MKIKTSELQGPALNWAVAKCEGFENLRENPHRFARHLIMNRGGTIKTLGELNYPTDWAQGGPIIEREGICLLDPTSNQNRNGLWHANCGAYGADGETALIAAMRCYVASKLGDEVDVPKELL